MVISGGNGLGAYVVAPGVTSPLLVPLAAAAPASEVAHRLRQRLDLGLAKSALVVNMATWCPVCRREISHLKRMAEDVGADLAFFGFSVDPKDGVDELAKYPEDVAPPYQILASATPAQREEMEASLKANFGDTPLPSSVLIDGDGYVITVFKGSPTLLYLRLVK